MARAPVEARFPTWAVTAEEAEGSPGGGKPSEPTSALFDEIRSWLLSKAEGKSRPVLEELLSMPSKSDGEERLRRIVSALAAVDSRAACLAEIWSAPPAEVYSACQNFCADNELPRTLRASVSTWGALWLVRAKLYDEAGQLLSQFEPEVSLAPEVFVYCRAVVAYQLGDGVQAKEWAERLLRWQKNLPVRYCLVAELILEDSRRWENSPLRQVSQWMNDVARRLDLAREDPAALSQQDRILEAIDRLIEQASQNQRKMVVASGGSQRSSAPAPDSLPLGGKGRGEVQSRSLGKFGSWGDLPPKEREEALQVFGREFPPHYRQAIEQYFRRLAEEPSGAGPNGGQ
jgi:tetratricopeptide (TPR) repeat protein